MNERSINWMTEIVEMEKLTDYTCNPEYISEWHRLMTEQETFIQRVLRDAEININVKRIGMVEVELNKMPKKLSFVAEAMTAVMQIIGTSKESLKKILVRGEFDEFPDDKHMLCKARLVEMLNKCSDQLHEGNVSDPKSNFLLEEIAILEEAKGINLPNLFRAMLFL
ncbi:hypothetical protein PRUPE_2G039700 [Prunus persica]|uniref:Dynamin stalk domain-containing protein n=1 Tax=Prunus persica TaxID=3760 RepID=A0A251QAV3_PRUPE|nr:hypothetical protein PRUPE_2G039700 [Prunus persica]